VSKLKLHLDADTSIRSLHQALLDCGHDVTRTPCEWMAEDATDEEKLLGATAQGRCLFTFNIRDFMVLAAVYSRHGHRGNQVERAVLRVRRPVPGDVQPARSGPRPSRISQPGVATDRERAAGG
jgi:hypothetical protein